MSNTQPALVFYMEGNVIDCFRSWYLNNASTDNAVFPCCYSLYIMKIPHFLSKRKGIIQRKVAVFESLGVLQTSMYWLLLADIMRTR